MTSVMIIHNMMVNVMMVSRLWVVDYMVSSKDLNNVSRHAKANVSEVLQHSVAQALSKQSRMCKPGRGAVRLNNKLV